MPGATSPRMYSRRLALGIGTVGAISFLMDSHYSPACTSRICGCWVLVVPTVGSCISRVTYVLDSMQYEGTTARGTKVRRGSSSVENSSVKKHHDEGFRAPVAIGSNGEGKTHLAVTGGSYRCSKRPRVRIRARHRQGVLDGSMSVNPNTLWPLIDSCSIRIGKDSEAIGVNMVRKLACKRPDIKGGLRRLEQQPGEVSRRPAQASREGGGNNTGIGAKVRGDK